MLVVLEHLLLIVQVQLMAEIVCFLQLLHLAAVMAAAEMMAVMVVVAAVLVIVLDNHILDQEQRVKVTMAVLTQLMSPHTLHQVVAVQDKQVKYQIQHLLVDMVEMELL